MGKVVLYGAGCRIQGKFMTCIRLNLSWTTHFSPFYWLISDLLFTRPSFFLRFIDLILTCSSLDHPFSLGFVGLLQAFPSSGQFLPQIPLVSYKLSLPQVQFSIFSLDKYPYGVYITSIINIPPQGISYKWTKRTSPLQTPWIPQSRRDLLRNHSPYKERKCSPWVIIILILPPRS